MFKNLLTFQVESILGAVFLIAVAAFFVGSMFISIKNFDSDIAVINSDNAYVKIVSITDTERALIDMWVRENNITLPPDLGYRYIIKEYPNKPWLQGEAF